MIKIKRERLLRLRKFWRTAWGKTVLIRIGKVFITIKQVDK